MELVRCFYQKVNFAAVFAELLPHSELAAAERCGVNLAQDLIDRLSPDSFFIGEGAK